MKPVFNDAIKQIADELIAMSVTLKDKMETWDDVFARHPDSQNASVGAGFISTQPGANIIEVVIDVQAPTDTNSATIRTKAIETMLDSNGNERFNGISLSYDVDYSLAQKLVEKAGSINREDISQLLHDTTSQLTWILISDETGRDKSSDQLLGKRYDLQSDELATITEDSREELLRALNTILTKLKKTATTEANA